MSKKDRKKAAKAKEAEVRAKVEAEKAADRQAVLDGTYVKRKRSFKEEWRYTPTPHKIAMFIGLALVLFLVIGTFWPMLFG